MEVEGKLVTLSANHQYVNLTYILHINKSTFVIYSLHIIFAYWYPFKAHLSTLL